MAIYAVLFACMFGASIADKFLFKTGWHYAILIIIGFIVGACFVVALEYLWKMHCPKCGESGFRSFQKKRNGPVFHECDLCGVKYKEYKEIKEGAVNEM